MSQGNNRQGWLEQLTDDELLNLANLILTEQTASKMLTPSEIRELAKARAAGAHFLRHSFSRNQLMILFYFLLFRVKKDQADHDVQIKLEKSLSHLKSLAQKNGAGLRKVRRDLTLIGRKIDNSAVGEVLVTAHAWERFCFRSGMANLRVEEIIERFKVSFARAKEEKISSGVRVRRLIDNGFQEATYLIDESLNLRYIISKDKEGEMGLFLQTVEVPLNIKR